MNKDTPAFPQVDLKDNYGMLVPDRQAGMTLRDYFAAKAMQTLLRENYRDTTARLAYEAADAMLKARDQ